jgi:hypothetical protein
VGRPTSVVTIASANYLPYVKTLMQSVRDTNPEYRRYFVLVDKKPLTDIVCGDLYEVIEADSLGIECFDDMALRYDVMEFNTAVKPFAIDWLFENTDTANVIYLDPDIRVYRSLHELDTALNEGAAAVVTPHLTRPLEDSKTPNDYHMLQVGVFNLGFIAVSRDAEAREFVRWWSRRLKVQCCVDIARNLFTDQRWVDLAPCYISKLKILLNPAYNVAYWNLAQRTVTPGGKTLLIDGRELAFFHFSGLDRNREEVVSKHQDRFGWSDIKPLHRLFKNYRAELKSNGWFKDGIKPYYYDTVGSIKIVPLIRRLYRQLYPQQPANAVWRDAFIRMLCNQSAKLPADREGRITALMYQIHRERTDLQATFNLETSEGIESFRHWCSVTTPREYGVATVFANPAQDEISASGKANLPSVLREPNAGKPWYFRKWRKIRKWYLERVSS